MDPEVLFHSCTETRLEIFSRRPRRTLSFTSSPQEAYRQTLKVKKIWGEEDPLVLVLTQPSHYNYVLKGGSGKWYKIHLRKSPIDISSDEVIVIGNPTLDQLCKYVSE